MNDADQDIIIYPDNGTLQPRETKIVKISLTPKVLGHLNCVLTCTPDDYLRSNVNLSLTGEVIVRSILINILDIQSVYIYSFHLYMGFVSSFQSPSLEVERTCIDFGVKPPKRLLEKTVSIKNPSCAPIIWTTGLNEEVEHLLFYVYRP